MDDQLDYSEAIDDENEVVTTTDCPIPENISSANTNANANCEKGENELEMNVLEVESKKRSRSPEANEERGEKNVDNNNSTSEIQPTKARAAGDRPDLTRSRRMFAGLMGHLGMAKKKLDQDKVIEKQKLIKTTVVERREKEFARAAEKSKAKRELESQMSTLAKEKNRLERQIKRLEDQLALESSATTDDDNSLRTVTKPHVLWSPAKHNETTQILLKDSKEKMENERSNKQQLHRNEITMTQSLLAEVISKIGKLKEESNLLDIAESSMDDNEMNEKHIEAVEKSTESANDNNVNSKSDIDEQKVGGDAMEINTSKDGENENDNDNDNDTIPIAKTTESVAKHEDGNNSDANKKENS